MVHRRQGRVCCLLLSMLLISNGGLQSVTGYGKASDRDVTLHVPLTLSLDSFKHLSTLHDSVTAANHCFAEILVTFDQANKTLLAWDEVIENFDRSGSPIPAATNSSESAPSSSDIAGRLACAAITIVNDTANQLEARCGRSVARRVIAVQIGSALVDSLLLDIFSVPVRQLKIAPLVMWKNAASFVFGIFLAKSTYVMHLDSDRVLSSRSGSLNDSMASIASAPIFVDLALDIFETFPNNVSSVMMPDCSDDRTGMTRWDDGGRSMRTKRLHKEPVVVKDREVYPEFIYQRAYNHKSVGKRWYYEQKKQPCGRSNALLPDVENCKARADLLNHAKVHSCGKTRNFFSTQAFIVKAADILKRLRNLRIKKLIFPWRAQIECILESAANQYPQEGIKNAKYIFVHPNISGVCKTYPRCHKPHHQKWYSVNMTNITADCTKGISEQQAMAMNETWRPCMRSFVNYTHPVAGCSSLDPSLREAVVATIGRHKMIRAQYQQCVSTGLHRSILNHGWQHDLHGSGGTVSKKKPGSGGDEGATAPPGKTAELVPSDSTEEVDAVAVQDRSKKEDVKARKEGKAEEADGPSSTKGVATADAVSMDSGAADTVKVKNGRDERQQQRSTASSSSRVEDGGGAGGASAGTPPPAPAAAAAHEPPMASADEQSTTVDAAIAAAVAAAGAAAVRWSR